MDSEIEPGITQTVSPIATVSNAFVWIEMGFPRFHYHHCPNHTLKHTMMDHYVATTSLSTFALGS